MEETAKLLVVNLSLAIEIVGAIVIGVALIQFIISYVGGFFSKKQYLSNSWIRVRFGSALALSLELLLAADILETAVAPSWEEIGKLAAIAAIRTALNYFLDKELRNVRNSTPIQDKEFFAGEK